MRDIVTLWAAMTSIILLTAPSRVGSISTGHFPGQSHFFLYCSLNIRMLVLSIQWFFLIIFILITLSSSGGPFCGPSSGRFYLPLWWVLYWLILANLVYYALWCSCPISWAVIGGKPQQNCHGTERHGAMLVLSEAFIFMCSLKAHSLAMTGY